MRLCVTLDQRFDRTPDGAVWTVTPPEYAFWNPCLDVFDRVRAIARVRAVAAPQPGARRADGAGVEFLDVPCYVGPWRYLMQAARVARIARAGVGPEDAVLLRIPSQLANALEPELRRRGHPYAVELLSDPHDFFGPGATPTPLRPLFRRWFTARVCAQCRMAALAGYVTARTLQKRYPPGLAAAAMFCSDAYLPEPAFVREPRTRAPRARMPRLVTVGMLDHFYKGQDVLLEALGQARRAGLDCELALVGDGRLRGLLAARAAALGLGERVRFLGERPAGEAVRAELDAADLFVLASRAEGLPRALLEAMARGLPAIATTAGGIPELLDAEDLVPPGDARALATLLKGVLDDPARLAAMSRRNLERARDYHDSRLRGLRLAFYRALRERTRNLLLHPASVGVSA